ncbi:hypothetical protein JAO73_19610 [Hymenobacter sp. BT523]|uniref:hypothetical protein n=1 Tax=Hymenobacter sp. BT523 TaxID=2795725 RepID=UPI0018EB5FB4|nr:hypothetical protein [Hymenobacter sp. BT523]MBJ6111238.1 hypothetical protein [Hymenobacter sp. BT523]
MRIPFAVSKHLFATAQFRLAGFCIVAFISSLAVGCTDKKTVDNTGSSGAANQGTNLSNEHENEAEQENEGEGMGMNHGRASAEGMDTMRRAGRAHSRGMGMMDKEHRR